MLEKFIQTEKYKDLASVIFFILAAILLIFVSSNNSFQISTNFLSNNNFASPSSTLFTSASRVLFNVEYKYLAIALLIILLLKLIYKLYSASTGLKTKKKSRLNTLNLNLDSFSYSMFMVFICLLAGLQDLSVIIFVLVSSFIGVKLILSSNEDRHDFKKQSILLASISWLLIIIYSLGTLAYGNVRSTLYVYTLDFICLIYFVFLISKDSRKGFIKRFKSTDRETVKYSIDLSLKLLFFIVLAFGIHQAI
ncbi:MAG TPA: hypothetical protein VMV24_02240 [Candidatus Dormibacteraeota bacterium]|nr:hypothetical protein [Candidatus Dormibacteraeota bacterium]